MLALNESKQLNIALILYLKKKLLALYLVKTQKTSFFKTYIQTINANKINAL